MAENPKQDTKLNFASIVLRDASTGKYVILVIDEARGEPNYDLLKLDINLAEDITEQLEKFLHDKNIQLLSYIELANETWIEHGPIEGKYMRIKSKAVCLYVEAIVKELDQLPLEEFYSAQLVSFEHLSTAMQDSYFNEKYITLSLKSIESLVEWSL